MLSNFFNYVDLFLNKTTMYKLTLYYLLVINVFALFLSSFGLLQYNVLGIFLNTAVAIFVGVFANFVFAKIFKAITNTESVFITCFILVLIVPLNFPEDTFFVALSCFMAISSKYLLTVSRRHIFNPVAIGVFSASLISNGVANWWVGTPLLLPVVFLGGILLARKTQRESLILSFILIFILISFFDVLIRTTSLYLYLSFLNINFLNSAFFFFAFVMLTEPITSPGVKKIRERFGYIVGIFYALSYTRIISIPIAPEIALCLGNIYAFFANPNYRMALSLKAKKKLSKDTYIFAFNKVFDFKFIPGQYMEWTLPHKNSDSRGVRRFFSISSSPSEDNISITVKFNNPSSTFKKELLNIASSKKIIASQVSGDFILPKNVKTPLVFIAGGVGIAPFRSMVQHIIEKNIKIDIYLLYSSKTEEEILFSDIFKKAQNLGLKTVYTLTDLENINDNWSGKRGYISEKMINEIPELKDRVFYISGPQIMVQNTEKILLKIGIMKKNIKTDFFPGYNESI